MSQAFDARAAAFLNGRYARLTRVVADLIRYGAASAAALALDYAVLLLGYKVLGLDYLVAAALGFSCGLALVYALSVRFVFGDRRRLRPSREFLGFLAIGLAGLLVNEALMRLFVENVDLSVALAKIPTAGLVFLFNFTARRALLFSPSAPRAPSAS